MNATTTCEKCGKPLGLFDGLLCEDCSNFKTVATYINTDMVQPPIYTHHEVPTITDIYGLKEEIKEQLDDPYNYIVKQDAYQLIIDIIDKYIET